MRADLHIHTTASDGRWPPQRLLREVKDHAIDLFAVTDHDTIANVAPTEVLAQESGLAFLRGVEVSSRLDGRLFHILAYGFDRDIGPLECLLSSNKALLEQANEATIRHLIASGYALDLDDYAAYQYDRTRGAWKAYNFLLDRGICTDFASYFDNPDISSPATISPFPHPREVIDAIRDANGVPVLAHPGASLGTEDVTEAILERLLAFGIAGVECFHRYNDEAVTRLCLDWCTERDLLVTGGSDCHGGFADRELGFPSVFTDDLRLGILEERIIYVYSDRSLAHWE